MLLDAALSVAHFLALLVMAGALSAEAFVLRLPVKGPVIPLLARTDALYGLSAGLLIAAGLSRVFFGLKDESYYGDSHAFWGKIAVFVIIGLLSILPTMQFIRWRRAYNTDAAFEPSETEVKRARLIVMIEAHLLIVVVIFAALMARGIG